MHQKNRDYAGNRGEYSNFETVERAGVCKTDVGIMVRLCDKWSRLTNIINTPPSVAEESVYDTIDDMVNYLTILKSWRLDQVQAGVEEEEIVNDLTHPLFALIDAIKTPEIREFYHSFLTDLGNARKLFNSRVQKWQDQKLKSAAGSDSAGTTASSPK